ncbi:MAG: hypothetical protein IKE24_12655 [Clostridia bacterium]|nr:hypothetical protein [Clostridia bacterium]
MKMNRETTGKNTFLRAGAAVLLLCCLLFGLAGAEVRLTEETDVLLPDGVHRLTLPGGMVSLTPDADEPDLKGIFLREPDLEMLVFAYAAHGATAESLAQALAAAGRDAQVRDIHGERFLVYRDRDEADGTPCVGYGYMYGDWLIEISFFYSTQEAADLTKTIMESFHQ